MATPTTNRNVNDQTNKNQRQGQKPDSALDNHSQDERPGQNPKGSAQSNSNNNNNDRFSAQPTKNSGVQPQQRKDRDQQDASKGNKLSTEDKLGQDETNIDESEEVSGISRKGSPAPKAAIDDEDIDVDETSKNTMDKSKQGKSDKGCCGS